MDGCRRKCRDPPASCRCSALTECRCRSCRNCRRRRETGQRCRWLRPGERVQQVEPGGEAFLHLGLQAVVVGGAPGQRAHDRAEARVLENAGLERGGAAGRGLRIRLVDVVEEDFVNSAVAHVGHVDQQTVAHIALHAEEPAPYLGVGRIGRHVLERRHFRVIVCGVE